MVIKKEPTEVLTSLGLARVIDPNPKILNGAGGAKREVVSCQTIIQKVLKERNRLRNEYSNLCN